MSSTASGSWENYHVCEHMRIATLFLKLLYQNRKFSLKLAVPGVPYAILADLEVIS
jgi:hypothetical protein